MKRTAEPAVTAGDTLAPVAAESFAAAPDELLRLADEATANEPPAPADPNAPPKPVEVDTAEVLAMLYTPLAAIAAPNWRLQPSECKALADAHALVLDKYWPGGMNTMGPELTALLVTMAIMGPRIMSKRPLREEPVTEKADAAA